MKNLILTLVVSLLWIGCNEGPFPPEVWSKTRPLGAVTDPLLPVAGASAKLMLHLATPLSTTLLVSNVKFITSGGSQELAASPSFAVVKDYQGLSHQTISFDLLLPSATDLKIASGKPGLVTYSFSVGDGLGAAIPVRGQIVVSADNPSLPTPANLELSITEFAPSLEQKKEHDLTGSLQKFQDEAVQVTWFVPSGRVRNWHRLTTVWEPDAPGAQTVILTARGRDSHAFAVTFRDVVVAP